MSRYFSEQLCQRRIFSRRSTSGTATFRKFAFFAFFIKTNAFYIDLAWVRSAERGTRNGFATLHYAQSVWFNEYHKKEYKNLDCTFYLNLFFLVSEAKRNEVVPRSALRIPHLNCILHSKFSLFTTFSFYAIIYSRRLPTMRNPNI